MSRKGTTKSTHPVTVYLAETSPDIASIREEIRQELEAYGYRVLPEVPIIGEQIAVKQQIEESLEDAHLAVHLIGRERGATISETTLDIIAVQNEIAIGFCHSNSLPRLIWLPVGAESNDEQHQNFLEQIRNDLDTQYGAELFETPIEELKFGIHDRLRRIVQHHGPATTASQPTSNTQPTLYLVCDRRDLDATLQLEDHLSQSGLEIVLPNMAGTPAEVRTAHIDALRACDAVLIYYGASSEQWVLSKIRDLQKVSGYGRKTRIEHACVFVAQPASTAKTHFFSPDIQIIRSEESPRPHSLLAPFVKQILGKGQAKANG